MADKPSNAQPAAVVANPNVAPVAAEPAKPSTDAQTRKATNAAIDSAAGAPPAMRDAAKALPEKDDGQKAHKRKLLANDAQTEAKANAEIVKLSPDAAETPSGGAMLKVAGIADDVERGEVYAREKHARRFGYVAVEQS